MLHLQAGRILEAKEIDLNAAGDIPWRHTTVVSHFALSNRWVKGHAADEPTEVSLKDAACAGQLSGTIRKWFGEGHIGILPTGSVLHNFFSLLIKASLLFGM